MTLKTLASGVCAAAVALSGAPSAFAQAPAQPARPPAVAAQTPAAAAPPVTHGPAIPGLCVMSVEAVIANSTVGKYVQTRVQQIAQQVNAELTAEQTAIQNEDRTLSGQRATLDTNTFEQRAAALQVRVNALQRKAQQRERELQATEQKAVGRVGQEMEPLIRQAYQQKQCSILVNRQAIVLAAPTLDLTPAVVTALNAKITQFTFDRERLDPAPQPAGAAAAPPPTQTPPRR